MGPSGPQGSGDESRKAHLRPASACPSDVREGCTSQGTQEGEVDLKVFFVRGKERGHRVTPYTVVVRKMPEAHVQKVSEHAGERACPEEGSLQFLVPHHISMHDFTACIGADWSARISTARPPIDRTEIRCLLVNIYDQCIARKGTHCRSVICQRLRVAATDTPRRITNGMESDAAAHVHANRPAFVNPRTRSVERLLPSNFAISGCAARIVLFRPLCQAETSETAPIEPSSSIGATAAALAPSNPLLALLTGARLGTSRGAFRPRSHTIGSEFVEARSHAGPREMKKAVLLPNAARETVSSSGNRCHIARRPIHAL